jgi:hypothetical protein
METHLTPDTILYILTAAALAYLRATGKCEQLRRRAPARRRRRASVGSSHG